jgi:hypothetical protein
MNMSFIICDASNMLLNNWIKFSQHFYQAQEIAIAIFIKFAIVTTKCKIMFAKKSYNCHNYEQNFSPMVLLFLKLSLSSFINCLILLQSVTQLIPSGHIYDVICTCFMLFKCLAKMPPIIEPIICQLTFSVPFCKYFTAKAKYFVKFLGIYKPVSITLLSI